MKILHLSDTHFGTEDPVVLRELTAAIEQLGPDIAILSGDITQRAKPSEFRAAQSFMQQIPGPEWVLVPGNHDLSLFNPFERFCRPYKRYLSLPGAELEPVLRKDGVLVIGLNTTSPFRHVDGVVTQEQIAHCQAQMAAAEGYVRRTLVVCHHPFEVVLPEDLENRIGNASEALAAWHEAGVDYVLGGHIHYPFLKTLKQPGCSPLHIVQAGTACSRRTRNQMSNSFNLLETGAGADRFERFAWDSASTRFELVESLQLPVS